LLSDEDLYRIFHLIDSLGIPIDTDVLNPDLLWQSLEERTVHRNGFQRIPMPQGIGKCVFLNDVTFEEIVSAVQRLKDRTTVKYDVI
jgi:3-dehydroquinate synthase